MVVRLSTVPPSAAADAASVSPHESSVLGKVVSSNPDLVVSQAQGFSVLSDCRGFSLVSWSEIFEKRRI